tara:strand:- start:695 stop:844 length:150 start_codon:yes stop_codon:yes gene_type:complete
MAKIFTTDDLTVPDDSELDTGDARREYNTKKKKKKKGYPLANNKYVEGK